MFEWIVPGRKNHSASWYTIAGIIALSLSIWGIFSGIYALTVVVIIMSGVYVLMENNAPDTTEAMINQNGVKIGDVFYDYGQISSFEIIFQQEVPKYLRMSLKKNNLKTIDIPVDMLGEFGIDIGDVRSFMLQYIPEGEGAEVTLVDRIIERLGL